MARTGARFNFGLPNGKNLDDYGKPSMRGKASKAGAELKLAGEQCMSSEVTVLSVPSNRKQVSWRLAIKKYLTRRGVEAVVSSCGDNEIVVKRG